MGIRVSIGGTAYHAENYSVSEESTPTSSDDSSGSVGTFSFSLRNVEDAFLLSGKEVSLLDTRRGTTIGFVVGVNETDHGTVEINCQSRLGRLNIYGVQAQPFSGTLQAAFQYYVGLANQTTDVLVDPQISGRPVVFPGWYGELWYFLKQMASAQDCEIALVSNVILLRPLRVREAIEHRDTARGRGYGDTSLAKAVEVYSYNNVPIENELVYPPGGWEPEVEVITVGAGETVERVIELSASVDYIQPPVMETFVSQNYRDSSVYTIVGDDGLPIMPEQWTAYGGRLSVEINDDTTSLTVTLRGAEGIQSAEGEAISTYSVALGSDFTGNRYSTLRIIGSGVAFDKQLLTVRTCIPEELSGTDVGVTIDNPFISTIDDAYSAGVKAAKWFAGEKMVLNGSVTSINRLGDSGEATYPTYEFDQEVHQGKTYAAVEAGYAGKTYRTIEQDYYDLVRDNFENQVFGNAGGARIWDRKSRRWYRSRTANIGPDIIGFSAEDDLIHDDLDALYAPLTYELERGLFPGLTYSERDRMGLYFKWIAPPTDGLFPGTDIFPSTSIYPEV